MVFEERKGSKQVSHFNISWPHINKRPQEKIEEGSQDLDIQMFHIFIDGPNINWKLYDSIKEERKDNDGYPNAQSKERITETSQSLMCFKYLFMDIDGLKTRK